MYAPAWRAALRGLRASFKASRSRPLRRVLRSDDLQRIYIAAVDSFVEESWELCRARYKRLGSAPRHPFHFD